MTQYSILSMYPLEMSGAPFENREEKTVHRFQELEKWLPTHSNFLMRCRVYRTAF